MDNNKKKLKKAWIRLATRLLAIGISCFLLLYFIIGIHVCHNNNMFPSIKDGDLVITYKLDEPYFGDLVAYKYNGTIYFGRIVGTPGEEIYISESGGYTLNGVTPFETIYYNTLRAEGSSIKYPYILGDNEYFILNDYREDYSDSRIYGGIYEIEGKVVLLFRRRGF